MSRLRLIAVAALALLLTLPGTTLAATTDIGGTVTAADGTTPVAGVEIAVLVVGTDEIIAATTDANGAWSLQVDVEPGAALEVNATGPTTRTEPDGEGCVKVTTPTARLQVAVAELPVPPIAITLDGAITSEVCSATATPGITPPATDLGPASPGSPRSGTLAVVGLVGALGAAILLATTRRRPARA